MDQRTPAQKHLDAASDYVKSEKFNAAFGEFRKAIQLRYGDSLAYLAFGDALLKAGRYPEAVEQFQKAIETDSGIALNIDHLSEALQHDKQQSDDVERIRRAVDACDRAEVFHEWAQVLTNISRNDEAVIAFTRALRKNPRIDLNVELLAKAVETSESPETRVKSLQADVDNINDAHLYNSWGQTLVELGRLDDAMAQFGKATKLESTWLVPAINWGDALMSKGDFAQAEKKFSEALKADHGSVEAYAGRGKALNQLEEHGRAIANYELAAQKAPAKIYFDDWLEALRQLPVSDSSITNYRRALDKFYPADSEPAAYQAWSEFLASRGRLEEAAVQYARSSIAGEEGAELSRLQELLAELQARDAILDEIQALFDQANDAGQFLTWAIVLANIPEIDRALAQLARALALTSEDNWPTGEIKNLLTAFRTTGNQERARTEIEARLVELDAPNMWVQWANILSELLAVDEALIWYRKALLRALVAPHLANRIAESLQNPTGRDAAIKSFQSAVTEAASANVSYNWGLALRELKRTKEALKEFSRAIQLKSDFPEAHFQLGQLYSEQGQHSAADREFQIAINLKPDNDEAAFAWSLALLQSGSKQEAIEKYLAAAKASPALLNRMPTFQEKLKWDDANITRFQQTIDEIATANAYNQWGILLTRIGQYERAIEQFKRSVALDPDQADTYVNWRKAVVYGGLAAGHVGDYENAIEKNLNNADAYNEWGLILYKMDRFDLAAEKLSKALEKDPHYKSARSLLIVCWISLNDLNAVRQECLTLLADDSTNGSAYNGLAWAAEVDGNYDEAIRQSELGIEAGSYGYLYDRLARALVKSGREETALDKLRESASEYGGEPDSHYIYGTLLLNLNRYDDAAKELQQAIDLNPDYAYARHNLAAIPFMQGKYEDAWELWNDAINVYGRRKAPLTRVLEDDEFVDSYEFYYHATLVQSLRQKLDEAETILKNGLTFAPTNTAILQALGELYKEQEEECLGFNSETNRKKADYRWRAMGCLRQAENLLKKQSTRYSNYNVLVDLGNVYIALEEYDKARECFQTARSKDDKSATPHTKLGVIELRQKYPEKAIPLFQEALKRNPADVEVKSSLAEAYMRAEKFEEAEDCYRQVLSMTSNHVQSLIGLGELCIALADKKDTERYADAIDHLTNALDIADKEECRSKYLKNQEKAAVYYLLGYARAQSYENSGVRLDVRPLNQALKDFRECRRFNPSHEKARRAVEKIEKRLGYFSRERLTETLGPRTIFAMSVIIFVAVQISFFGLPLFNKPSLVLNDKSLQAMSKQVPQDVLQKVESLRDHKFPTADALISALEPLVKSEQLESVKSAALQNIGTTKPLENAPQIETGYYGLLSFGSLLFMVVGLYLPQVLKLRVAGIELEKSSVDQAATGGTLGIKK